MKESHNFVFHMSFIMELIKMAEQEDMRKAMLFLQQYGIALNLGIKIYQFYGQEMYLVSKLLASCQQQYLQKIYIVLFLI